MKKILFSVSILVLLFSAAGVFFGAAKVNKKGGGTMSVRITSSAFQEGGMIPSRYTCDGDNISPPLEWIGLPDTVKSIALICDDPDAPAGTWVHWVIFNIPPKTKGMKENVSHSKILEDGSRQGINDSRDIGYDGPCPPGGIHRYFFKIYGLDCMLNLDPGASKADLVRAMNGHVTAEGQLMGRYKRQ